MPCDCEKPTSVTVEYNGPAKECGAKAADETLHCCLDELFPGMQADDGVYTVFATVEFASTPAPATVEVGA